jgi:MOSC domain-containing protein YiiM
MKQQPQIAGVFIGAQSGAAKTPVTSVPLIAEHGAQGDRHAGTHPLRHVSLFAQEVLQAIQTEGFNVEAGELSANLFTENLSLDELPVGARLRIGEALLEIVERRKPCRSITKIDHRLTKRLVNQCGQLARVVQGGVITVGDAIELIPAAQLSEFYLAAA